MEENYDWKSVIQAKLDEIVDAEEIPEGTVYLMGNQDRGGNKITSYSVCIYEPDYPMLPNSKKDTSRNAIVINIKENAETLELAIDKNDFEVINTPCEAVIKSVKSDKDNIHVVFSKAYEGLGDYIKQIAQYALDNYIPKAASFGCCSLYEACSDAKKCIHENRMYSKACSYRKHLEAGRIFYGKNKNID